MFRSYDHLQVKIYIFPRENGHGQSETWINELRMGCHEILYFVMREICDCAELECSFAEKSETIHFRL
jgi:hypothetical protein